MMTRLHVDINKVTKSNVVIIIITVLYLFHKPDDQRLTQNIMEITVISSKVEPDMQVKVFHEVHPKIMLTYKFKYIQQPKRKMLFHNFSHSGRMASIL